MTPKQPSLAQKHHRYSQIREEIQTGDLLGWRVTKVTTFFDFVLILYQKLFKAKFSHVAVALRIGHRVFAVEAVPNKVRLIPLSMLGNFYWVRAGIKDHPKLFDLLVRYIGRPYSVLDLAKAQFNLGSSEVDLYCSELALNFYDLIGYFEKDIDEFDDRVPTPDDIIERVIEQSDSPIEFVRIDKGNIHDL